VHVVEHGVVGGAEPVPDVPPGHGRLPHRGEVPGVVDPLDLLVGRLLRNEQLHPVEDAEGGRQPHGQLEANRMQRMLTTEVVPEQRGVPHDRTRQAHDTTLSRGARPSPITEPRLYSVYSAPRCAAHPASPPVATSRSGSALQFDQDPA
jgi:hypothetical protein